MANVPLGKTRASATSAAPQSRAMKPSVAKQRLKKVVKTSVAKQPLKRVVKTSVAKHPLIRVVKTSVAKQPRKKSVVKTSVGKQTTRKRVVKASVSSSLPGVMKAKYVASSPKPARERTQASCLSCGKIRLGFICGKWIDPIPIGTQDRAYPEEFKCRNNTSKNPNASGWGGQFHVDVSLALKVGRLHPDVFEIDLIQDVDMTTARLAKNHLNFNMWYDEMCALQTGDKKHADIVARAQQFERLWPSWDYVNWVYHKSRYMWQCVVAGLPIIPTIFLEGKGFDPEEVLRRAEKQGWDRFLCKAGHLAMFGQGAVSGSTRALREDPTVLRRFQAEEAGDRKEWLLQPYVLKPNGEVFDEIRHFFIDGQFSYAVYTDGTDYDKVYTQPQGAVLKKTKALATRAYAEVLRVCFFQGEPFIPPLVRIDIAILPSRAHTAGVETFINEIEMEQTTWLCRYCPYNLVNRMASIYVTKARVLLGRLLAKNKMPEAKLVEEGLRVLEDRLGKI